MPLAGHPEIRVNKPQSALVLCQYPISITARLVEANPLWIASDCSAELRNASQRHCTLVGLSK